jgi:uncharacterized caspase-like protein
MRRLWVAVLFLTGIAFALFATAADNGNRYALVIGINNYELLGKLDSARQDAEAFADVLLQNCGFDPDRLCLITDNPKRGHEFQPTFTNVQRRFEYFTAAPQPGDSVLVYFAGHGVLEEI